MKIELNKIYCGDSLEVLKTFPDEIVDCVITSPPYWGLRDYGVSGQLGLEKTPEEYVAKMVEVFREVKRVLKREGTCWLNLGDSYVGGGRGGKWQRGKGSMEEGRYDNGQRIGLPTGDIPGLKSKDLVGIPWRVAFALQADGWYLRQDIIWHKPNPMPESVTDRCTKSHEYVFLLTKSPKYYFDNEAIKEMSVAPDSVHIHKDGNKMDSVKGEKLYATKPQRTMGGYLTRNKRSVWTITTKPFRDAHFATFPEDLIIPMVKAGCPSQTISCNKCGIVLGYRYDTKTIYRMQEVWEKMSKIQLGKAPSILFEAMQFFLGGSKSENNEGMDNNKQRIQSNQCERKVCNGTPNCNGKETKQETISERGCPSHQREKDRQSSGESDSNDIEISQSSTKTEKKRDNKLSSLWEENKNIGSCPKCGGNIRINKGIILDIFMGAGTTGVVCKKLGRNYVGIELNPKYVEMAEKRIISIPQKLI